MKKTYFILLIYVIAIICLSIIYTFLHINISDAKINNKSVSLPFIQKSEENKSYIFECILHSKMTKKRNIGIVVDDQINKIILNGKIIDLTYHKKKYSQSVLDDWSAGYQFNLLLKRGENNLSISANDHGGYYAVNIKTGMSADEFLILFIFVVLPFMYATMKIFFMFITRENLKKFTKLSLSYLPIIIILIGILLRMYFLLHVNGDFFQHDLFAHKEMITYYVEHGLDFAQADKLTQAPQQILYYLVSSSIYSAVLAQNFSSEQAFELIRWSSLIYSSGMLISGYYLIRLFTTRILYVSMFLSFLAFTPYIIFMSGQISNDPLNAFLGMLSLYYILSYHKHPTQKKFLFALVAISLAIITKISSLLFALMFLMILLLHYFFFAKDKSSFFLQELIERKILLLSIVTIFIFLSALLKAYIPAIGEFRFINSGLFDGQVIPILDISYFFSFNFFDLISQGQSYVFGENSISHSLLTYQYGNMFLGEYDYSEYYLPNNIFKLLSQLIYLFGILYIIGTIFYIYSYKKLRTLSRILIIPVGINLMLIVHLLSDYWVISNSDFRYYAPVFGAIGLIFVLGWKVILDQRKEYIEIFVLIITFFYCIQIYWIIYLIQLLSSQ